MRKRRNKPTSSIDMSPLMDLTFMLLIIFVITVPSMYYKSDVQLTPPASTTPDKMEVKENSVFVELDRNGAVWLGGENSRRSRSILSAEDLTARLRELAEGRPELTVYLVGDRERPYREVIDIANAVQKAQINTLSLVFNPEEGSGGRN